MNLPIQSSAPQDFAVPIFLAAREYNVPVVVGPCSDPIFIQVNHVPIWIKRPSVYAACDFVRREA